MKTGKKISRRSFLKKTAGSIVAAGLATQLTEILSFGKDEIVVRAAMSMGHFSAIDPHTANEHTGYTVVAAMHNSLVRNPPGGASADPKALEGDLAQKWEHNKDMTEWTFYLRQGVRWQKGFGEFTAEDVEFSIERVKNPKTGSAWSKRFANVDVKVVDKYTVKIKTPSPDPLFLTKVLDWQTGNIACKKAAEKLGEFYPVNPVGTGPFELREYRPGDRAILVPFKDHFRWKKGEVPYTNIDRIEIVLYGDETSADAAVWGGIAHLMQAESGFKPRTELAKAKGINSWKLWPPTPCIVRCNFDIPPLNDIRVRKAIAHALNPKEGAKILGQGTDFALYSNTPYPSKEPFGIYGGLDLDKPIYPYDPDKSRRLLAEAGYAKGLDLGNVYSGPWESWKTLYEIIQDQLSKVGIKFNLNVLEAPSFFKLSRAGSNPLPIYQASRFPDANYYLDEFLHSRNFPGQNMGHFKNDKFDKLVDKAWAETDPGKRVKMLQEAQLIALEEAAGMPLTQMYVMLLGNPRVDLGYPSGDPAKTGIAKTWNQYHKISERIRWRT
ncbi:MAG: twin-arginine translocation signal domain-containing protein [Deltaproteobacteria bacterium]|nr:twin-arginine translocation signal domain-containing protein [Deltaproteobacteria bacterium]